MVTIEVPVKVPEYIKSDGSSTNSLPLEFMICRRRNMKSVLQQYTYLKNFVTAIQPRNLKAADS
jgi:hypothetical protein